MVHALKTLPEFFSEVGKGKTFEVRKNDGGSHMRWYRDWETKRETMEIVSERACSLFWLVS